MPYLTPTGDVPTGLLCRPVFIPDDPQWLALVSGALSELIKPGNFEQLPGGLPVDTVVQQFEALLSSYYDSACEVPPPNLANSTILFHEDATVINGAPLTAIPVPNGFTGYEALVQPFSRMAYMDPPSGADEWLLTVDLPAGSYRIWVLGITESAAGITQWFVDGNPAAVHDWYSVIPVANVQQLIGAFTFATAGTHEILGLINSQNAASGGQYHSLTAYIILPD